MSATLPELSVVLPCYYEQEVLPETAKRLAAKLTALQMAGFAISALSFPLGAWALIAALAFSVTAPDWTSTMAPIYLICGIQMLSLGGGGEYVGKIYMETKQRPRFVFDELTWASTGLKSGDADPVIRRARHARRP